MKFKTVTVFILCLLLISVSAFAVQPSVESMRNQVRKNLESLGFDISDEDFEATCQQISDYLEMLGTELDMHDLYEEYNTPETFAYNLLVNEGFGIYDYDTYVWSPTSDKIYVLDTEVFNVDQMYSEFLQGINAIVPDTEFVNVQEDLSGMDDESDYSFFSEGSRSVTFSCNGHTYSTELASYGDWLNTKIIDFVNQVLEKENCAGRIHCISDADQLLFLIYGSEEYADTLRKYLGTDKYADVYSDPLTDSLWDILAGVFSFAG